MKTIEKVNKKAFVQIRQISTAHNMLEVESAINTAILKTFGLKDLGLIKIAMRKESTELLKQYGAYAYNGNFDLLKSIRNFNHDTYADEVKKYLISFIPERMRVCEMYKKLTA